MGNDQNNRYFVVVSDSLGLEVRWLAKVCECKVSTIYSWRSRKKIDGTFKRLMPEESYKKLCGALVGRGIFNTTEEICKWVKRRL